MANTRSPGGGRPPGGIPATTESESSLEMESDATLFETLQDLLSQLSGSEDSETVHKTSDLLVWGLLGVDEEA